MKSIIYLIVLSPVSIDKREMVYAVILNVLTGYIDADIGNFICALVKISISITGYSFDLRFAVSYYIHSLCHTSAQK